jgi:hypothetical protein
MKHNLYDRDWTRYISVRLGLVCIVLAAALSSFALAQSGRKPPQQPKSPDPLPQKQDEPPIVQPSNKPSSSQIPVKVIWYLPNIGTSSIYSEIVEDGCLERLSQSNAVKAIAGREMNRKEAIDAAKASADSYVLWFELDVDAIDAQRTMGSVPPQYLYVKYEVFTPGTGKTRTSGHVYQRGRATPGVPLPGPQTGSTADYSLRYAGREMADRLLDALSLSHPK